MISATKPLVVVVGMLTACLLFLAVVLAPQASIAKPEFAQKTGKPCGVCHVNPGGGGKLKPAGEKFKKNRNK
jgi:hypothetical protein